MATTVKIVAEFNEKYPVGSTGRLTLDSGKQIQTEVRHHAVVNNSGDPVCWFKGVTGYYVIDRFEPKRK